MYYWDNLLNFAQLKLIKMVAFSDITYCVSDELVKFHETFEQMLHTKIPLADNIIRYFLDRQGKQLRPVMAILAAKMLKGEITDTTIYGAVALELLHNASLMHDDVIDKSDERRGMSTVNKVWDNKVAVLMGDFFLSKCLVASNNTGSLDVSNILANMVIRLSEGELEQLSNVRSHLLSESAYFSVISGKTASLFSACMKVGAITVGGAADQIEQMGQIGELMGLIFQIRDDIFDYYDSSEIGKPTGNDMREGKLTLPIIYAVRHTTDEHILDQIEQLKAGSLTDEGISELIEFAKSNGGIEYAQQVMEDYRDKAVNLLPKDADDSILEAITAYLDFVIGRTK